MAEALTQGQIAEFQEAFCLINKDFDASVSEVNVIDFQGVIKLQELAAVIQSPDERPTKEEVDDMISEDGVESNGTIDFEEFLNIMARKMQENVAEEPKVAFKVFHRDQDGYISASELRQVMINLGERLSHEEADMDGDGLVSYEEFARMMLAS